MLPSPCAASHTTPVTSCHMSPARSAPRAITNGTASEPSPFSNSTVSSRSFGRLSMSAQHCLQSFPQLRSDWSIAVSKGRQKSSSSASSRLTAELAPSSSPYGSSGSKIIESSLPFGKEHKFKSQKKHHFAHLVNYILIGL